MEELGQPKFHKACSNVAGKRRKSQRNIVKIILKLQFFSEATMHNWRSRHGYTFMLSMVAPEVINTTISRASNDDEIATIFE